MHDFDERAGAFWQFHRLFTSKDRSERLRSDDYRWASEEIDELIDENPVEAIPILVALADEAPDDGALGWLGAGAVENLVSHHGSDAVIDEVEMAARQNERFRKALASAWYDDYVSPEVCARLRAFGGRVRLPAPATEKKGRRKGAGARTRDRGRKRNQRGNGRGGQ